MPDFAREVMKELFGSCCLLPMFVVWYSLDLDGEWLEKFY